MLPSALVTRRTLLLGTLSASCLPHRASGAETSGRDAVIHGNGAGSSSGSHVDAETLWHDPVEWGVEGKGWTDTERFYDRFPARAKGSVPDSVWDLSRHSAGLCVRFRTDSPSIHLRMDLHSPGLSMPHMPATGVSGFDLYARDSRGKWQWVHSARPEAQHVEGPLIDGLAPGLKEFVGYLPLYNGVEQLAVGVAAGARFEPITPNTHRPIAFYGTSICQGGCASRPGLAYTAIVGRMLDRPVINLGFS